jgi:hypothetical protein
MADGADLTLDTSALDRDGDALVRAYLRAGTRTVHVVTRRLEQRIEGLVRTAAGGKLWRAVQSSVYPSRAVEAQNPVGEIWLKGTARTKGAFAFWTEPGQVQRRGGSGEWMPVPLPAAGGRNRQGLIDPHVWEMAHPEWRLDLLWRDGKRPLLVAHLRDRRRGDAYGAKRGRARGGVTEGQPIFALVPFIAQRNAVAIEPEVRRAEGELEAEFFTQAASVR